jgi:hypothetical protein
MKEIIDLYSLKFEGAKEKLQSFEDLCSDDADATFYKLIINKYKITDEDNVSNRSIKKYHEF